MPISLPSDLDAVLDGFVGPECHRRRQILRETLWALGTGDYPTSHHAVAQANLARWAAARARTQAPARVEVLPGDWGDVALQATQRSGTCFAVLNMANAYVPGGAYGEGASAQEENMFRRSDCHFAVSEAELAEDGRSYLPAMTELLSGRTGQVYLDIARPRVCIRGSEDRGQPDLGYPWLPDDQIFPFFELRASAQDLRDGSAFDAIDARRRIAAILDTLVSAGVRHVVLGAIGCGAFENPPSEVAGLFHDELRARLGHFDRVVFAIRSAGYGPDNFTPFVQALSGLG